MLVFQIQRLLLCLVWKGLSQDIQIIFLDVIILPTISEATIKYTHGIGKDKIEELWGTVLINKLDNIMEKFVDLSKEEVKS